jgi:biotin carboxyl carrier protein
VLEVKVDIGAVVKRGDSLILLEAMKMEYEINARQTAQCRGSSHPAGRLWKPAHR